MTPTLGCLYEDPFIHRSRLLASEPANVDQRQQVQAPAAGAQLTIVSRWSHPQL